MNAAFCCDASRRDAVAADGRFNGIDGLEVLDRRAPAGSPRQRTLFVRCLRPVAGLTRANVVVDGGERVRDIGVEWAHPADAVPAAVASVAERNLFAALADADRVLVVRADAYGDASRYRLRLVRGPGNPLPPAGFDPLLVEVEFSFKVECEHDFDCDAKATCPSPAREEPAIDYLAKDYATFRRLLLDRMREQLPEWREKSPADLAVTLVELLAYAGDFMSYRQDAVATEAHLARARSRVSLRRHARLVDYAIQDGANARAWLHLRVRADGAVVAPNALRFLTRVDGVAPGVVPPGSDALGRVLAGRPETFEAVFVDGMAPVPLVLAHNELPLYTWGERGCCLPKGATRATLSGHYERLHAGDVLAFEEVKGAVTGRAEDALPDHRHVVRLIAVEHTRAGAPLTDELTGVAITEIAWHPDDALPFPLCLSARLDADHGGQLVDGISVARGNMVLVDHGATVADEPLGVVPSATVFLPAGEGTPCEPARPTPLPPRFRPWLQQAPVSRVGRVGRLIEAGGRKRVVKAAFDPDASAGAALRWPAGDTLPQVWLTSTEDGDAFDWHVQPDLLRSGATDRHFVVETESDGRSRLRFGDGDLGRRPGGGTPFVARYRVGNGTAGNVGAEAICYAVTNDARIALVRNLLAARGGGDPETAAQVRRRAPQAFATQERAVTAEDYAAFAGRVPTVQRAAATPRWTGSWHTMFVNVDRENAARVDAGFQTSVRDALERYRMAGHDLEIDAPVYVSLRLTLDVCVKPDYFRADVVAALSAVFSNRTLPDGRKGYFHPDNFTFADPVYLSPILAAAHAVPGVLSATATVFEKAHELATNAYLQAAGMTLGRLEIARLDNDPDFPEHGVLVIHARGGK